MPLCVGLCVFLFQATQGVQVNCFRTLGDLVLGYQNPRKGLVAPLLYPVMRESEPNDESSGKMRHKAECTNNRIA